MSAVTARGADGSALKIGVVGTIIVLVIAEVVAAFETSMAMQLLYSPDEFFSSDMNELIWIVTAYALAGALATSFVGRLGDQFGRRNVLIAVLVISIIGSAISALAPNLTIVVVGRALQGVSAAVLPLCIGVVRATFPKEKIAMGVAVVTTSALVAGAAGSLVGGVVLDFASWHWIFWVAAILATLAVILTLACIYADPRSTLAGSTKIDWVGGLLFGVGIAAALFGATKSKDLGWSDPLVLSCVIGGAIAIGLWFMWELRVSDPMIDVRMFADKKFSLGMLATALIAVGPIGMTSVLSITIYRTPHLVPGANGEMIALPVGLGQTATMAGVLGFITAAASFATAPLIGKINDKMGARVGLMIGALLTVLGMGIVALSPANFVIAYGGLIIGVFGTGFLYSGMPTVIVECVPQERTSAATGVNAVIRTTFQAVASSIVALMLTTSPIVVDGNSYTSLTGLYLVIGACVVTSLLTLFVVSRIPKREPIIDPSETKVLIEETK